MAARVLAVGMNGIAIIDYSPFFIVALLLSAAVFAATWVPVMRATRVDPVEALRSD